MTTFMQAGSDEADLACSMQTGLLEDDADQ